MGEKNDTPSAKDPQPRVHEEKKNKLINVENSTMMFFSQMEAYIQYQKNATSNYASSIYYDAGQNQ